MLPKTKRPRKSRPARRGKTEPFKIDLDGIGNRIVALPMPPASLQALGAAKGFVYYVTAPVIGLSGPLPGEDFAIHVFDLKERKDQCPRVRRQRLMPSRSTARNCSIPRPKRRRGRRERVPTAFTESSTPRPGPRSHKVGDGALNLSGVGTEIDPLAEWKQMFDETYRQERDYFFEPAMNGVDWAKERDQYAQLLPYVADRYDLTYVLGEMIGEFANSHTYVGGGDYPDLHPVNLGVLGVDFEVDAASGLYRFKKIYPGENWNAALRSPLTEPGVEVKEGDYLVAVNGRDLYASPGSLRAVRQHRRRERDAHRQLQTADDGARNVVVKPLSSEFDLRLLDMVNTNRRKVDQATGGRVGYIYIPDMEGDGLNEFVKQFFPQIRKEGLIIDVRYNGGGFVDQLIFERLRRILAAWTPPATSPAPPSPTWSLTAPWPASPTPTPLPTATSSATTSRSTTWARDRHAHLGRCPRHSRRDSAARRRLYHPAGIPATGSTASGSSRIMAWSRILKSITRPTWS